MIQTIWYGKWKIASIVAVFLLSVFVFNIVTPNTNFTASTEIKPVTSFEFDKYSLFNSSLKVIEKNKIEEKTEETFSIFEITQKSLLSLYIEELEEGSILETGIDKFDLINKKEFNSEEDYKDAVEKFASEIRILKPAQNDSEPVLYNILRAEYDNKDKWKQLLTFVNNEANKRVKAIIINRFSTVISIQNQKKDFAIQDLNIEINNVKNDYVRNTKIRLAFLNEQAAIARKLDIKKSTISSQRFNAQNTFVTNVKTDAPFYLRGYLAIEEEIRQINDRTDKSAFTKGLFKLEQLKRALEQDKTMLRSVDLFNKTPLNQTNFKATIVKIATTDFEVKNKSNLYYFLAIVLGGMIGVVYVLMAKAFKSRKIIM